MFIKRRGLTIIVRCVTIEQKVIFIFDFSFYADVSSHGVNNLSLNFAIKAVPQQYSRTSCIATPMGKFYWSAPFHFPLFFSIFCRMRFLKKYNTRFLLSACLFLKLLRPLTFNNNNLKSSDTIFKFVFSHTHNQRKNAEAIQFKFKNVVKNCPYR